MISPVSTKAVRAVSAWATISILRRSERSTITPAGSASSSIGMPLANDTIPSQVGEPVRS